MCHHAHDAVHRSWLREETDREDADEAEDEEIPSFAREERDVDVDLLDDDD